MKSRKKEETNSYICNKILNSCIRIKTREEALKFKKLRNKGGKF